jgi:hypothetical protein
MMSGRSLQESVLQVTSSCINPHYNFCITVHISPLSTGILVLLDHLGCYSAALVFSEIGYQMWHTMYIITRPYLVGDVSGTIIRIQGIFLYYWRNNKLKMPE